MSVRIYYTLNVVVGRHGGEERALSEGEVITVGSASDAGLHLEDKGVGDVHARVSFEDDELTLMLLDGHVAKVNGLKTKGVKRLRNGDRVIFGDAVVRVGKRRHFFSSPPGEAASSEAPAAGSPTASPPPPSTPPVPVPTTSPPTPAPTATPVAAGSPTSTPPTPTPPTTAPPTTTPPTTTPPTTTPPTATPPPPAQTLNGSWSTPPSPAPTLPPDEAGVGEHAMELAPGSLDDDERSAAQQAARRAGMWWPWEQLPPLELQHVWFDLERDADWRSLAIVPTDDGLPVLAVAHSFARMASMNPRSNVLVVDATPGTGVGDRADASTVAAAVMRCPGATYDFLDATALGMNDADVAHIYVPQLLRYISTEAANHKKVIIALGPLLENAQSIPVARRVDAVLMGLEVGHTRLPDVGRTADIIGRERIRGAIALERRG